MPTCWVLPLVPAEWPGECQVAAFDSARLRLEALPGERPDLAGQVAPGERVAVVCERSSGQGVNRTLHWEISALDPQVEDVIDELAQNGSTSARGEQGKSLASELSAALARRPRLPEAAAKIVQ